MNIWENALPIEGADGEVRYNTNIEAYFLFLPLSLCKPLNMAAFIRRVAVGSAMQCSDAGCVMEWTRVIPTCDVDVAVLAAWLGASTVASQAKGCVVVPMDKTEHWHDWTDV